MSAKPCHACDWPRHRCRATFVCRKCGRTLNVCKHRVGRKHVCVKCWEAATFGPEWSTEWDKSTKHRRSPGTVARLVKAAAEYQRLAGSGKRRKVGS